jgi:hypothetical protein
MYIIIIIIIIIIICCCVAGCGGGDGSYHTNAERSLSCQNIWACPCSSLLSGRLLLLGT